MKKFKKSLVVIFFSGMVLFLAGCIQTQEYIYEDDAFKRVDEEAKINQIQEKKEEKWIGSPLAEDKFIRQCPVCLRRYSDSIEKCPYDGAKLEEIKR